MSDPKKTVALVDDHPIVIEGLKSVIAAWNEQYNVLSFSDGQSILTYLENYHVDLVMLDISLPDINGLEVCKYIKLKNPRTKVIGLSNLADYSVISLMLEYGASGFILKGVPSSEILIGIEKVLQGETVLSSEVKTILENHSHQSKALPSLTKREKQLIQLLAQGKTTTQIADELSLSKLTIDSYRKNLLQKFNVRNSSELLVLLIENKMI